MSLEETISENCLFLICPTDHMEHVLNQTHGKKAYFYTALGANFCWDLVTQESIIKLIESRNISQIIFITKYTNQFYQEMVTSKGHSLFRISQTLRKIEKTLPHHFLEQSHPILKTMLLASRNLQRQSADILATPILGEKLKQDKVVTKCFVYYPETEIFYTSETIEKKVLLYGQLCIN